LLTFPRDKRSQVIILIGSVSIGWVTNIINLTGLSPIQGFDLTPVSFVFISLVLTWFIFRKQLFDLLPIARGILMDNMTDGVIVLDDDGRVIDYNQAATDITRYEGNAPIGLKIWEMYEKYIPQISHLRDQTDLQVELELPTDPPRYLDVKIDSIGEENDQGQVITVRDVTSRKLIEIQEREQRLFAEALTEVTSLLNSSLNLDEVLDQILENVNLVVPHDAANIALVDKDGLLRFRKVKGYKKYGTRDAIMSIVTRVDEVPNLKCMAETGSPSINPDTWADPEWLKDMPGAGWIRSYVGAPIISSATLLGFINVDAETPNFFKTDQMYRLQAFANQAAVAIRNAQLYNEMELLAITDSLTGLYNRRYFFEFAGNEITKSKRYKKNLSMIMMDIDHFKKVNDRFGHQVGDRVLKNVADICLSILRNADIMCRFGGEEFLILLPETTKDEAENAAERMCRAVADSVIQTDRGEVKITLSIGVAELDMEHDSVDSMIFAADKALYLAKAAGRDCVRVYS
jgi:diguanylate cyclase (GGDEF)-like protein/PAS domain S-box-containing protein